jgi:hypothetical protein
MVAGGARLDNARGAASRSGENGDAGTASVRVPRLGGPSTKARRLRTCATTRCQTGVAGEVAAGLAWSMQAMHAVGWVPVAALLAATAAGQAVR